MSKRPTPGSKPDRNKEALITELQKALEEALVHNKATQTKLEAQRSRRTETQRALDEARAERDRVALERDELRQQLERLDSLHATTLALPDEPAADDSEIEQPLPTIDELMAELDHMQESVGNAAAARRERARQLVRDEAAEEMLPPAVVFPEEYGEKKPDSAPVAPPRTTRVLVRLDGEHPIKYPLYQSEMTLGRSEAADIEINSKFVSRMHARIKIEPDGTVVVEDVESKNGVLVNSQRAERHTLQHGDVLALGPVTFRFLDAGSNDET